MAAGVGVEVAQMPQMQEVEGGGEATRAGREGQVAGAGVVGRLMLR